MQEHWLHSYEKYIIQELLPDFTCHVKSFDDNKIIDHMERQGAMVVLRFV